MDIEALNQTLKQPVPNLDYPIAVDQYGRPVDPTTILQMRLPKAGEGATSNSIFNAQGDKGEMRVVTVQDQLEMLYQQGFRGRAIINLHGPHPLAEREENKATIRTQKYPSTECRICTSYIKGRPKLKGYSLLELRHAGQAGCLVCAALYKGVTHFAGILQLEYEDWESSIRQGSVDDSMLLSETKTISVDFCQDDEDVAHLEYACEATPGSATSPRDVHARIIDTSSHSTAKLVRSWIDRCSREHRECYIRSETPLPPRLVEVSNHRVRLVETEGKIGAFLALSHCWGRTQIARTTKGNLEERKREIPWSSLSQTFKDAVSFTWNLGYRYIWIDSLCIIQDDRSDWEIHAAQMAKIFSRAQLTISATRAKDGDEGCFSIRSREPFEYTYRGVLEQQRNVPAMWEDFKIDVCDRDGVVKDLSIRAKSTHGVQQSPLLQRAWVFQEQILSPRIIHFASGELYWECKSYVFCECEGWEKRSESLQMETRRRKAHSRLVDFKPSLCQPLLKSEKGQHSRSFEAYRSLVEQYTATRITQVQDRLPALSGISFGRNDQYLAGMWRSMLIESLHWISSRKTSHPMAYRSSSYCGPTWSWVSVEAPIRHLGEFSSEYSGHEETEFTVTVVAASCTPEGLDPRGRVTSGYLKLQGPLFRCKVAGVTVRTDPWKQQSDTYAELRLRDLVGQCELDIPLSLARNPPAEIVPGQEVVLLKITTNVAIVLDEMIDIPGAYRRIGIFWMKEHKMPEEWFKGSSEQAIFIL